uniref:C-type lectin domain-containing protein n=1 Tax=Mola mola TaxID=94237 RepID=A0A3Q3XHT3_MOLML
MWPFFFGNVLQFSLSALEGNYGVIHRSRFHDATPFDHKPFFCYSPTVVRERKTWEEAVEYCREHRTDLASVASETEVALIRTELGKNDTTGDVWIGLHFFSGEWLWVDGQTLAYEVWGCEGRPACPDTSNAVCNASSKHAWQAHNCEERLHFVCY